MPAGKKNNQEPVEKPEPFFEWHKKETLYPFTLNLKTLTQQKLKDLKLNTLKDTFKVIGDGKYVNVLNTKDGFELIYDAEQGEVLSYMGLQYSFKQTQESFYDLRTSQF